MAKTKTKARPRVMATQPAPAPTNILLPGQASGFDPRQLEGVSGASRKDFDYQSQSEGLAEQTFEKASENASLVEKAWQERIKKEGITYYVCPICTGSEQAFEGKNLKKAQAACAAHIKKEHPQRMKELKMLKAPKALYEPKRKVKSPKRTMADAVHPKYRDQVEAQLAQAKALKPLRDQSQALSRQGNHLIKLVTMTEALAIQQLPKLSNEDLRSIYQMAANRGKRLLSRAAHRLCAAKGIDVNQQKEPSARAKAIQEALVQQAYTSAQKAR